MCVALAALDARVLAMGRGGERAIAFADFHRLPGDAPQRDTNLGDDEIITAVELPANGFSANYSYLKIRDRLSYVSRLSLSQPPSTSTMAWSGRPALHLAALLTNPAAWPR